LAFLAAVGFFSFLEIANQHANYVIWWEMTAVVWVIGLTLLLWSREKKFLVWLLPFFIFLVGSSLLLLFLDRPIFRHFLIIISSLLIWWYLIEKDRLKEKVAEEMKGKTEIILLFSLFFLISILSGWLTFLARQFWPVLLLAEIFFFLFYLSFFVLRGLAARLAILPALAAALFMGELFWTLNLLSLGFLTRALLFTLSAIYLAFVFNWRLQKVFFQKKFLALSGFFLILIIIILSSTRWI